MADDAQEDATNSIVASLAEQRALRAEDNSLWSVEDCAKAFLRDLQRGEIKPTRVLILYEEPLPGGGSMLSGYVANMKRPDEIALLELRKHQQLHRWIKGE